MEEVVTHFTSLDKISLFYLFSETLKKPARKCMRKAEGGGGGGWGNLIFVGKKWLLKNRYLPKGSRC